LALTLVVAQCLLLSHQADLELHEADGGCEFCLHSGSLGNALSSNVVELFPFSPSHFIVDALGSFSGLLRDYPAIQARAPPTSSFV